MGRRQKMTPEEGELIEELLEQGLRPHEMTLKVGRSANAIYWYLKSKGINITGKVRRPAPAIILSDEIDYADLPDNVLFNPKMFPSF